MFFQQIRNLPIFNKNILARKIRKDFAYFCLIVVPKLSDSGVCDYLYYIKGLPEAFQITDSCTFNLRTKARLLHSDRSNKPFSKFTDYRRMTGLTTKHSKQCIYT